MTQETFKLLDNLSQEGINNCCSGFVQDVNTKDYFGTEENVNLEGMYLYIYQRKDDWFAHIKEKPEYTFDIDGKDNLLLFKLE
jgi:hypothetical protein